MTEKKKTNEVMRVFDGYERRFAKARLDKKMRDIVPDIGRGDLMRVFAQMECVL